MAKQKTLEDYLHFPVWLLRKAEILEMEPEKLARRVLTQPFPVRDDFTNNEPKVLIPGHGWRAKKRGPLKHYKWMIVGKMPGKQEESQHYLFRGPSSRMLKNRLEDAGYDIKDFYVTNVSRFFTDKMSARIKNAQLPLLLLDVLAVNPELIVLLGADAVKAFFGNGSSLTNYRNALWEWRDKKIVCITHPAEVLRNAEKKEEFDYDFALLENVLEGGGVDEDEYDFRYIYDEETAKQVITESIERGDTVYATDVETGHGRNFMDADIRTVQVTYRGHQAWCFICYDEHGNRFLSYDFLRVWLNKLWDRPGVKILGQFIKYDAHFLHKIGVPIMNWFFMDLSLGAHLLRSTQKLQLELLAGKYIGKPRWDRKIKALIKEMKIKDWEGFERMPSEDLLPYSCHDTDGTFRTSKKVISKLVKRPPLKRLWKKVLKPACHAVFEMEETGIPADWDRLWFLMNSLNNKAEELTVEIQDMVKDKDFNPRSNDQKRELLFDTLKLTPLKATKSYGNNQPWDLVVERGEVDKCRPATDSDTLRANLDAHPVVEKLLQFSLVDQAVKNFLRPPVAWDEEERPIFDSGLLYYVDSDGFMRSTLHMTAETGRMKSREPNLQNLPNARSYEIQEIMGPGFPSFRSFVRAPKGYVLVEADYSQAELFTMALYSRCDSMLEELKDPRRDMHAETAIEFFRIDGWDGKVNPKKWLKDTGKENYRKAAKAVRFGINYQMAAQALRVDVRAKSGIILTVQEAQNMINAYYDKYPEAKAFVEACNRKVYQPGYIDTIWGRRREFMSGLEDRAMKDQQREAGNFPIQSTVADALYCAMGHLINIRRERNLHFRFCLAIHDAIMLLSPEQEAEQCKEAMVEAMTERTVLPRFDFHLPVGVDITERWG